MTASVPAVDLSKTKVIRLRTSPEWLPEHLRNRGGRIKISFKPCDGERQIYRYRKYIAPSAWAPKYRKVTYGPLEDSYWDPEFMPHFNGIMDASLHPSVKEIGNCKAPQTGSSAGDETLIGYLADRAPGPGMVIYPDRDTTSQRSTDYLQPMFTKSPVLRRLLTGVQDDLASTRIKLKTMLLYMAWAGSATSTGNKSIRYLFADEIDKYPPTPNKKEGGIMGYIRQRVRAFKYGSKIWWVSTPTSKAGLIYRYMTKEAEVVFDYHVPCPHCGGYQAMDFDRIMKSFPKDFKDPKKMEKEKAARYLCQHCGGAWDDRQRDKALLLGEWRARDDGREMWEYLNAVNPEKICFHSPAWISPLVSLSEIAAWWLRGLQDKNDMKTFVTQYKAEPWVDYESEREEDRILALRVPHLPMGLVPGDGQVAALVAGVDTQDHGFYYVIRAFGWGLTQESWQIRFGEVDTWEALKKILFEDQYKDVAGNFYPVHIAVEDAMGHRTDDVYDYSRECPGRLIPYQGHQRKQTPTSWSNIDVYPGTKRPIPGGVRLLQGDATFFKNRLAGKLNINPADPGAFHLCAEATEEYARHMCSEYRDENNLWQCPKSSPNHYWDCEYMALVAAEVLGIRFWAKPEPVSKQESENRQDDDNPFTGGKDLFG